MERTQTQVQNQNQTQVKIPVIGYQQVCYRVDILEVVYCPDENRFCVPEKINSDYVKYNVQPGKYAVLKYVKNALNYCVEVGLIEINDEGLVTEYEIYKRICSSDERSKNTPRVIKEFVLTMLSNYVYHCYHIRSPQEVVEHTLSELAKKQFDERDTLELLDWITSQDP